MGLKQKQFIEWMNQDIFSKAEDQFKQEIARLTKIDIDRFRQRVREDKKQEFDKKEFVTDAENAYDSYGEIFLLDRYFGIFASIELEQPDEVMVFTQEGLKYAGYIRFCDYTPLLFEVHAGPPEYPGLPKKIFLEGCSEETMTVHDECRLEKRLVIYNELDSLEKVRDKKVLIIDDAIETGGTLSAAYHLIKRHNPKELRVVFDDLSGNSILYRDILPIKSVKYCGYDMDLGFEYSNMPVSLFKELLEKAQEQFIKNI